MNDLFLRALACENHEGRPPVWLMRQAGRYMPEYRKLREQYSLHKLFHTPELAAEVTLQPVNRLGVDAAILFSDILVILEMLGFTIHFPNGKSPYVEPLIEDACHLEVRPAEEILSYVRKTIELVKPDLAVPLIGFCGGPYTVASYLLGKEKTQEWVLHRKEALHELLEKITLATLDYLRMQTEAGVQVIQIFDSWAGLLPSGPFAEFSLSYLRKLVQATTVPVILFTRGSSHYAKELAELRPAAISFDGQKEIALLRKEIPQNIAVQGNLEPEVLLGSREFVTEKTQALLASMREEPGFIVNLGHGVLPATPVENVAAFIETVKQSAPQSQHG